MSAGSFNDGLDDVLVSNGKNIKLTIDASLQLYVEKLLYGKVGSVVAIEPSSGNIFLDDKNFSLLSNNALSKIRLENFGFVYQFHHLLDDLSVEENIFMPLMLNNTFNSSNKIIAKDLMKTLDIYKIKDHLPWKLS